VWREGPNVYKISRGVAAVTENEVAVRKAIESAHLVKLVGYRDVRPEEAPNSQVRSFLEGYPYKPASIWEFVEGQSMQEFVEDDSVPIEQAYNCLMQVFYTILELQDKYRFVHGDLHSTNVRVTKDTSGQQFVWQFGGKHWRLPNLGYKAIIIDLGNAILWDRPADLLIPMYGYKVGDVCLFYDPTFDLRVFGDSVAQILWNTRASRFCHRFKLFLDNIFRLYGPGHLDSEAGRPIPIVDFYGELADALAELKLPKPLERAEDHLDAILCLVWLPLDDNVTLPPDLFNGAGELSRRRLRALFFTKKSPISKFFEKWQNFAWMLHSRQSDFLLESICTWCRQTDQHRPTAQLEAEFYQFVDERFKLMGLDSIVLAKPSVSLLMAYTFALQGELRRLVTLLTAPFFSELRSMFTNTARFVERALDTNLATAFALGVSSLEQYL